VSDGHGCCSCQPGVTRSVARIAAAAGAGAEPVWPVFPHCAIHHELAGPLCGASCSALGDVSMSAAFIDWGWSQPRERAMKVDVAAGWSAQLDRLDMIAESALKQLVTSRQLVAQSRRSVSDTHQLVARSRRRLNPWFGLAGASDEELPDALRQSIRARLASGALFPVGSRVIAGNGSGNLCVVCRNRVDQYEIEYEIPLGEGVAVVTHIRCYVAWRNESVRQDQRRTA